MSGYPKILRSEAETTVLDTGDQSGSEGSGNDLGNSNTDVTNGVGNADKVTGTEDWR